jgi:hypothetical protein
MNRNIIMSLMQSDIKQWAIVFDKEGIVDNTWQRYCQFLKMDGINNCGMYKTKSKW